MKRLLITIITAALMIGGLTWADIPAQATARCTQSFDAGVDQGVSPNFGESRWRTVGCGFYIRGRSLCASRFNGSVWVYGPFRTAVDHWSRATCTSARPVIQEEDSQIKHSANGAITTCEEWPNFNC